LQRSERRALGSARRVAHDDELDKVRFSKWQPRRVFLVF
jgi:hypothetical protein